MKRRNAAGQRSPGTIGAAHGINAEPFGGLLRGLHIEMSYSVSNRIIQKRYKIICHTGFFSHIDHLLFIKIELDIACEYLILFAQSAGDDGEGIGDTVLSILERKLGNR